MVLVLTIVFSPFIASEIWQLFHPVAGPPITAAHLRGLLIVEPILALQALWLLRLRGWRFESLGLRVDLKGTLEGVLLAAATWIVCVVVFYLAWVLLPLDVQEWRKPLAASGIAPELALVVSIVNPLFEEIFVAGYVVSTLKAQDKAWLGINLSAGIRLAYHLYQGQRGILSVLPVGLVFAGWYRRTGRLWPLVVAHAIFDFTGLMAASG